MNKLVLIITLFCVSLWLGMTIESQKDFLTPKFGARQRSSSLSSADSTSSRRSSHSHTTYQSPYSQSAIKKERRNSRRQSSNMEMNLDELTNSFTELREQAANLEEKYRHIADDNDD